LDSQEVICCFITLAERRPETYSVTKASVGFDMDLSGVRVIVNNNNSLVAL